MSVKLRLKRVGMTKQAHYRLVAIDHRRSSTGKELEVLGHYNPKEKSNALTIESERIKLWLSRGAQPSDTVRTLLTRSGFYTAKAEAQQTQAPA